MKSILICTPGRCGSHWVSFILRYCLSMQAIPTDTAKALDLTRPGCVFMSHDLLSRFGDAPIPIIVAVRHPADAAISAAHYIADCVQDEDRETVRRFWGSCPRGGLEAQLRRVSMSGHHPRWWADYAKSRVPHHLVRYEDWITDRQGNIFKSLFAFLGVEVADDVLAEALRSDSAFKRHPVQNQLYGTGEVNVWRRYFNEQQRMAFLRAHGPAMSVLGYEMPEVEL